MLDSLLVIVVVAAIASGGYLIIVYNNLVQVNHNVDQAWANIDVLLKQRHDELPKLIDTVKAYMGHERGVLERLVALRVQAGKGGPDAQRLAAEGQITQGLTQLFAVAEGYPALKADGAFRELQQRITGIETQLAHRREYYNDAVNMNNVRMEQFPDSLMVGVAGIKPRHLYEVATSDKEDVNVGALFST